MAERPRGYGLTAELKDKLDSKFDPELAYAVFSWMEELIGEPISIADYTQEDITESLKDGVVLCKLANVIQEGVVPKVNQSKMAFKMMENIGKFLDACNCFGMKPTDLFQTVDLYEGANIPQVINSLAALGRKVHTLNSTLPGLGPKESERNERNFSEEELKAGQTIIGLQMGSNQGASQAGMTPYGLGRQIEKTNLKT